MNSLRSLINIKPACCLLFIVPYFLSPEIHDCGPSKLILPYQADFYQHVELSEKLFLRKEGKDKDNFHQHS